MQLISREEIEREEDRCVLKNCEKIDKENEIKI